MRVWEFDDNKSIPSDLVREQDFILRVRRMQRNGEVCFILNLLLNAIEALAKNHIAMEAAHRKIREFAQVTNGGFYEMSNGDVFIVWEGSEDAEIISSRLIEAILPGHSDTADLLLTYHMPKEYAALRERTNHYVEVVRATAALEAANPGLHVESARGQLTAKNVEQIGHLLGEVDLRAYGRTQRIYRAAGAGWEVTGEEYFISFDDLRRERFPKLDIATSDHFFFALCGMIDQRILTMMTTHHETIDGRMMNLNLSVPTILSPVFAQFVRAMPRERRPLLGFELHRGDLFSDFSLTLSAIDVLKREGFRVILDSITPDMAAYVDLGAFAVDAIKINVSKDRVQQLADPAIRKGLSRAGGDRLIFYRCDNEKALTAGHEIGVELYQGWLIDDLAGKK